jgi:hypothetical protein
MFLQGTFSKSLEVSEKSLWLKQSKNCQDMGLEFYGLTRKWFMQMDMELVHLNGIRKKVRKKKNSHARTEWRQTVTRDREQLFVIEKMADVQNDYVLQNNVSDVIKDLSILLQKNTQNVVWMKMSRRS